MWMLWAVLGCGDSSDDDGGNTGVPGELDLEFAPTQVDFGDVRLGESTEQLLTIHNGGTSDVYVADLATSDPSLEVTGFSSPKIRAGADEQVTIEWRPAVVAVLDGSLDLRVGTSLDALSDLEVPLIGTVSGPQLTPSVPTYDMGVVSVGCSETLSLTLANTGTEELVVSSLRLTNTLEFTLDADGTGVGPTLPIRIGAGLDRTIDVVYTPAAEHTANTTVQIVSNDAIAPTTTVRVDGEGLIEASNTLSWTVEGQQAVTGIVQVNEGVRSGTAGDRLDDFVPAFFEGLLDADVSFRVAIVMHEDGHVDGDLPYIDDSFTLEEAMAAADDMLSGGSLYGDNDSGLETCLNAIEENDDWLLDDGALWEESKLNLAVINFDVEQSPADAAHYLELYDEYKDDSSNIAVHGIAGAPTMGCTAGGLYAAPSYNLYQATLDSGGVFVSFCDSDWTKTAATLVGAFTGDIETFVLTGNPWPESIEVHVDGAQIFSGWWYDAKTGAVMFDDATYPARGAELRVDYLMAVTCD
jgi:hypothetical protein